MYYENNTVSFTDSDCYRYTRKLQNFDEIAIVIEVATSIWPDGSKRFSECLMDVSVSANNVEVEFYTEKIVKLEYESPDGYGMREESSVIRYPIETIHLPPSGEDVLPKGEVLDALREKGREEDITAWKEGHTANLTKRSHYISFLAVYDEEEIPDFLPQDLSIIRLERGKQCMIDAPSWKIDPYNNEYDIKDIRSIVGAYKSDYRYSFVSMSSPQ
jgi:hypothetical protein